MTVLTEEAENSDCIRTGCLGDKGPRPAISE